MERIANDNDAVRTVRATLERVGRTDRPRIDLPDGERDAFPVGEVVRVALDGRTRHARVHRGLDDGLELRALYDNPRQARTGDGEDRLPAWVADRDLAFGRSVLVDVVDEGFFYGVRAPSESAVYEVPDRPDDGLAAIARDLEEP
ncbi:DUF7112 family protein [Haloglomus halophilum]|uniref:DUF7112 family protein n=1 Tax=Haloglomus halophilum TaxID=2962672 RepID=UPI0020C989E8|nr:hypothetical protein [Haloglomus halophilum]